MYAAKRISEAALVAQGARPQPCKIAGNNRKMLIIFEIYKADMLFCI